MPSPRSSVCYLVGNLRATAPGGVPRGLQAAAVCDGVGERIGAVRAAREGQIQHGGEWEGREGGWGGVIDIMHGHNRMTMGRGGHKNVGGGEG